ncbi:MAG: MFS transporter [Bryobacter sp.]|nr:MFS transporter [Bryobacter sp.]
MSASEQGAIDEASLAYRGWRVVLAAHLGTMVSFGSLLVFTFGIFLKPLTAEFGWSREEVSRAFAIGAMTVAAVSPFLGYALDRFGPRRIILPCFLLFAAGLLALSQLNGQLWQLYAIFFLLGIGGNGTTQMGYSGAVASWFTRKRGMALALVITGVGIGSIVHPLLAEWCISRFGWRQAYVAMGCLALLLGLPPTALWVKRKVLPAPSLDQPEKGFRNALLTREFWLLVLVLFLGSIAANGTLTHLAAHLTDRGFSTGHAALAAALLGGANLVGRLATGWLLDRLFGPRLSFFLLLLMALGFALLTIADSLPIAVFGSVLIGLGLGGEADITPYLLSRYFKLNSFSALYGITWTFYAIGGALGPVLFGRVFDLSRNYTVVLQFAAAITLLAALLMFAMRAYPERRKLPTDVVPAT